MGALHDSEDGWCHIWQTLPSPSLLPTAASERSGVAGGLRFDPGASQHDVMMILYEPARAARSEPNGTSCLVGGMAK
jgi:hypothetical protein